MEKKKGERERENDFIYIFKYKIKEYMWTRSWWIYCWSQMKFRFSCVEFLLQMSWSIFGIIHQRDNDYNLHISKKKKMIKLILIVILFKEFLLNWITQSNVLWGWRVKTYHSFMESYINYGVWTIEFRWSTMFPCSVLLFQKRH